MLRFTCTITLSEYRAAAYYGLVLRMRRLILAFLLCVALAAAYLAAGQFGLLPYSPILNFIAAAYFVFLIVQFGRLEMGIYRYAKAKDCLIGVPIEYVFSDTTFTVTIPSLGEKNRYDTASIVCVFEITQSFLVYINEQQFFLLSKASLPKGTEGDLRIFFATHLKERFRSRIFSKANASVGRRFPR